MKDDNDRFLTGTLSADPLADARPLGEAASGTDFTRDSEWGVPLPIGPVAHVPEFPADTLPPRLQRWVAALADALQCPLDLPAMLALAVLALSCAKKFVVRVRPDWDEPLNLYVAVALKSGESKSPAFAAAIRPVTQFVSSERKRQDPQVRVATARREVATKRLDYLKVQAGKTKTSKEHDDLLKSIEEAVLAESQTILPAHLRLVLEDVTPESVAVVLREQGGRIAIMSDEGGPFELMGGRYSDGIPNIDIYLKGYSGSQSITDRIARKGASIHNPAITIGIALQPDVIASLGERKGFRGRGLLARFIWSIPKSRVGERRADSPAMPELVRSEYEEAVTALLELPTQKDDDGEIKAEAISLDEKAYASLLEFKQRIEPTLGPGGDLEPIADWGNKLVGTVIRLAGLFHLADRAGRPFDPPVGSIGEEEIQRAIRVAGYLLTHARVAFDMMSADPVARDARHILAWIQRRHLTVFTRRTAHQALRARFRTTADMEGPLDLLVDLEVLRRRPDPPQVGPGRPPCPAYDVNPQVHAQVAENPVEGPPRGDSVNSVHGSGSSNSSLPTSTHPSGDGTRGGH